jgi:hypothetical protein
MMQFHHLRKAPEQSGIGRYPFQDGLPDDSDGFNQSHFSISMCCRVYPALRRAFVSAALLAAQDGLSLFVTATWASIRKAHPRRKVRARQ